MHENPIPSANHLFGDLRVARFIRIPEVPATYPQDEEKEAETQENEDLNPRLLE